MAFIVMLRVIVHEYLGLEGTHGKERGILFVAHNKATVYKTRDAARQVIRRSMTYRPTDEKGDYRIVKLVSPPL